MLKKQINLILKSLLETNFFEDIQLKLNNNILTIQVTELPIIQNIFFEGIKSSKNDRKYKVTKLDQGKIFIQ